MAKFEDKKQLKCSFCGKNQDQVRRLIAGPGVYICEDVYKRQVNNGLNKRV